MNNNHLKFPGSLRLSHPSFLLKTLPCQDPKNTASGVRGRCGETTVAYHRSRDSNIADFLRRVHQFLTDYQRRVEAIESFVFMHCVGIQLEKNFSNSRAEALTGVSITVHRHVDILSSTHVKSLLRNFSYAISADSDHPPSPSPCLLS